MKRLRAPVMRPSTRRDDAAGPRGGRTQIAPAALQESFGSRADARPAAMRKPRAGRLAPQNPQVRRAALSCSVKLARGVGTHECMLTAVVGPTPKHALSPTLHGWHARREYVSACWAPWMWQRATCTGSKAAKASATRVGDESQAFGGQGRSVCGRPHNCTGRLPMHGGAAPRP